MKIHELMKENMEDIIRTTKQTSWKTRQCHADLWVRLLGDREAESLTKEELEAWVRERKQTHAEATVKCEWNMLHRALRLAADNGWIRANPSEKVKVRFKPARRHQILTEDGEKRLRRAYLATVQDGEIQWLVEKFALLTGLRLCEQAHLRPRHIQGDLLQVPDEGKTGRRLVPLCKLATEIGALFRRIAQDAGVDYLFFQDSQKDCRLRAADSYVRRIFRPCCKVAGLEGLQRRDIRRTFASRLVNAGKPIYDVQHLLGHSNPDTTMIYARIDLQQLRRTVAVFD